MGISEHLLGVLRRAVQLDQRALRVCVAGYDCGESGDDGAGVVSKGYGNTGGSLVEVAGRDRVAECADLVELASHGRGIYQGGRGEGGEGLGEDARACVAVGERQQQEA